MSQSPSQRPSSPRPATPAEALERAAAALRAGRPDEAERLAAAVLRSSPASVPAAQALGQALLMQGRAGEATAPLRRAAKKGDPATLTLLSRALAESGDGPGALTALRRAAESRPAYPLAFLELGNRLAATGRHDEAAAVFDQGVTLCPDAVGLHLGLGYLRLARNDRAGAREAFRSAEAAAPGRHDVTVALANVLVLDGDYAPAAELYRQAIALRPDEPQTRLNLARCLLELGDRPAGEAALRGVAHSGPGLAGPALCALAAAPRGRFFLRPSAAVRFLRAS